MSDRRALKLPGDIPQDIAELGYRAAEEDLRQLVALAQSSDKVRSKAARKVLFVLKQHGIHPPELQSQSSPVQVGEAPSERFGYITPATELGVRYIAFPVRSDTDVLAFVSFGFDGALEGCHPRGGTFADLINAREAAKRPEDGGLARVPLDYCRHMVERGIALARQTGRLVPLGAHSVLSLLPTPTRRYERCYIYDLISEDEVASDPLKQYPGEALLRVAPCLAGLFDEDELAPWVEQAIQLGESRIILTQAQVFLRVERLWREMATDLFTPSRMEAVLWFLEHEALVFYQLGKVQPAKLFLHHAVQGRRAASPVQWPLALATVRKLLAERMPARSGSKLRGTPDDWYEHDDDDASNDAEDAAPRIIIPGR